MPVKTFPVVMTRNYVGFILVLYVSNLNVFCCRSQHQLLESRAPQPKLPKGEDDITYEEGYVVKTILDGKKINTSIYTISSVPGDDYVYAVDMHASQVLKVKLPIDENTNIVQVAGSVDGEAGHKDGWGKSSLFNHPKDLAVDDDGNVYVADARDCVIRKINQEGVVSTIAGESKIPGYADGEGKKAHFSADFDVTYISSICSLIISDRGNRRLRLIQLRKPEVCKVARSSREFSVGAEGLFFVVSATIVMSTVSVLAFKNVKLRERLAGLQLLVANSLIWTRSGEGPYTLLQNGDLHPNGREPLLQTRSLPATVPERLPDLIDLSYDTSAANGRHAPAITDEAHYNRGADDPAENSVTFPCAQSAPAPLISDQETVRDIQSRPDLGL